MLADFLEIINIPLELEQFHDEEKIHFKKSHHSSTCNSEWRGREIRRRGNPNNYFMPVCCLSKF